MAQCRAKAKGTGEQCKRSALPGSSVCKHHGGLTPSGTASPHFRGGKYSKLLPLRLETRYQEALNDPELLSCKAELAVLDARIADVMKRLDTGEAGQLWLDAKIAFKAFREAMAAGNLDAVRKTLTQLDVTLGRGYQDSIAWGELINLMKDRERFAASERKRILEAKQFVTMEQHAVLTAAIYQAVKQEVSDPDTLQRIGRNLAKLMNRPEPGTGETLSD